MSSAFSIDFLEPTSNIKMPITFLFVDKNTKCGCPFSKLDHKDNFGNLKMSGFAEIFTFSSPAPVVSVLVDIAYYAASSLI